MATILQNESAWSTTAATNANVDTGVNWAEGQDAASVNDSARGMMTARAKARLDQGGALVAAGTANALTVTTNQVLSTAHLVEGLRLLVRATAQNTALDVTLSVDGLIAISIKRADGSSLAVGDIQSGMNLDLVFYAASSQFRCLNITPSGPGKSSFSAHLNGNNIAPGTTSPAHISFVVLPYNVGAHASVGGDWTPPAGTVSLTASVFTASGLTAAHLLVLYIYKNGVALKAQHVPGNATYAISATLTIHDQANGSDVYTMFVSSTNVAYIIDGTISLTYFQGSLL